MDTRWDGAAGLNVRNIQTHVVHIQHGPISPLDPMIRERSLCAYVVGDAGCDGDDDSDLTLNVHSHSATRYGGISAHLYKSHCHVSMYSKVTARANSTEWSILSSYDCHLHRRRRRHILIADAPIH